MDPDIFDNKQIFVLNTLYWCQIAPKKIQPKSTLGKYVFNEIHNGADSKTMITVVVPEV